MPTFPGTKRYFISFRKSDVLLTPTFSFFKNASTFANISAPTIYELQDGRYYFDWTFTTKNDPDIVFQVDGGSSIPTEEVRYANGQISPRDLFLDEPISQVVTDVWTDSTTYSAGQKGLRVDQIGDPSNTSASSTVFGKVLLYTERIRGDSAGLTDGEDIKTARDRVMGGTGYGGTGVDVKTVKDTIGTPSDTSSSSTVFGRSLLYTERIRGDSAGLTDGNSEKQIYDRIGLPAGASVSADIAALQLTESTINTKIGTPVVSVSSDIAAVKSDTAAIKVKTDNLPSDPASQSTTNTSISNAVTSIKGAGSKDLTQVDTAVAAIVPAIQGVGGPTLLSMAGASFSSGTDSLHNLALSIAALVAPDNATIAAIKLETDKIGDATNTTGASTVFGKIYAARDSIQGADSRDLTQIAGTGFSTGTMSLKASYDSMRRMLGMLHENSVLDSTTFDTNNNLLSGRLRLYGSKADADAAVLAGGFPATYDTNKIAEYTISAVYVGTDLTSYEVARVA